MGTAPVLWCGENVGAMGHGAMGSNRNINFLSLQLFFQNIKIFQALKAHLEPLLLCERH